MDDAEFWRLVERANAESGGDCAAQTALLVNWLSERAPEEIVAFDRIMSALMALSYDWRLWAAAYIINGGCSNDGFDYFRGWLITRGKDVFYRALADPETLVDVAPADEVASGTVECEDMLGVAWDAYQRRTGEELPANSIPWPAEPTGEEWEEDKVDEVLPTLAAWATALQHGPCERDGA